MKSRLMRPAALYFPLAGLLTAVFGDASYPEMLLIFYCMIQLFSFCAVDAFRNAAAREPGRRRVDKRFWGSLLPLLLGLGLSLYLTGFHPRSEEPLMGASPMCLAAWLIVIEQLFEERMYAIGKNVDGHLLALLSSLLLFTGMMADCAWVRYSPLHGVGTFCGAALGALISQVASFIV